MQNNQKNFHIFYIFINAILAEKTISERCLSYHSQVDVSFYYFGDLIITGETVICVYELDELHDASTTREQKLLLRIYQEVSK